MASAEQSPGAAASGTVRRARAYLTGCGSPCRWALLLVCYVAVAGLHLQVSLAITTPFSLLGRSVTIADHTGRLTAVLAAGLGLVLAWQTVRRRACLRVLAAWSLWAAAAAGCCLLLITHPNEAVHFPQYAVIALLLSWCLDPERTARPVVRVLFWTTVLGAADEMNQYFFLCSAYGAYFDWNDIVLNLVGAGAGLLVRYGRASRAGPAERLARSAQGGFIPEAATAIAAALLVAALWLSGTLSFSAPSEIPPGGVMRQGERTVVFLERTPGVYGSWQPKAGGGSFYVLTGFQALLALPLLLSLLSLAVATAARKPRSPRGGSAKGSQARTPLIC